MRWQGPHHSQGYGLCGSDGYAHRAAWQREVGPIPEGHQIDHVKARGCVYRDCVSIEHLEPVTRAENIRRIPRIQAQITRTECPQGHKYADGNLRVRRGKRECRRCHNDRTAARKRERRSK